MTFTPTPDGLPLSWQSFWSPLVELLDVIKVATGVAEPTNESELALNPV